MGKKGKGMNEKEKDAKCKQTRKKKAEREAKKKARKAEEQTSRAKAEEERRIAGGKSYAEWQEREKARIEAIPKMPDEYEPDYIVVDGQTSGGVPEDIDFNSPTFLDGMKKYEPSRKGFAVYYEEGGNTNPFGEFKGEVIKEERNRMLFKRIWYKIELDDYECTTYEGTEDHVWFVDASAFKEAGVKVGDSVKFNALSYAYRRKDGSSDFGLKCPENIEIIPAYELPDQKKLDLCSALDGIKQLVCETCLFTDHCYGTPCIANQEEKDMKEKRLIFSSPDIIAGLRDIFRPELDKDVYLGVAPVDVDDKTAEDVLDNTGYRMLPGVIVFSSTVENPLHGGDRILEINGHSINSTDDLQNVMDSISKDHFVGDIVNVKKDSYGKDPETVDVPLVLKDEMVDIEIMLTPLYKLREMADMAAHKDAERSA